MANDAIKIKSLMIKPLNLCSSINQHATILTKEGRIKEKAIKIRSLYCNIIV